MSKLKLFCIPYAGGSASVYLKWKTYLHPEIELVPIELAGKGARFYDSVYSSFDECIDDVFNQISSHDSDIPYIILGHSLGAVISYEVTKKIVSESKATPVKLILSGCRSPQSARPRKKMHLLPEDEFIEELRKLGGTSEEILTDPDLLEIFLPVIRADYKMRSFYAVQKFDNPLPVSFTILNGTSDDLYPEEIHGWQAFTSNPCEYLFYEGNHFFIEEKYTEIISYINKIIRTLEKMGVK